METKHTPGPWELVRNGRQGFLEVSAQGTPIANVRSRWRGPAVNDMGANAALIVQAPELLAERDRLREQQAQLLEALLLADCALRGGKVRHKGKAIDPLVIISAAIAAAKP